MYRYHKEVYFPNNSLLSIKKLTEELNSLKWKFAGHCLDNVKYRTIDVNGMLLFIAKTQLNSEDVFEYYAEENSGNIEKLCYRLDWNKAMDIILVLNKYKTIITIYLNSKDDKHYTLKRELYIQNAC